MDIIVTIYRYIMCIRRTHIYLYITWKQPLWISNSETVVAVYDRYN